MNWQTEFSWVPSYCGETMPSEQERRQKEVDELLTERIAQCAEVMRLVFAISPEDVNFLPLDLFGGTD